MVQQHLVATASLFLSAQLCGVMLLFLLFHMFSFGGPEAPVHMRMTLQGRATHGRPLAPRPLISRLSFFGILCYIPVGVATPIRNYYPVALRCC